MSGQDIPCDFESVTREWHLMFPDVPSSDTQHPTLEQYLTARVAQFVRDSFAKVDDHTRQNYGVFEVILNDPGWNDDPEPNPVQS